MKLHPLNSIFLLITLSLLSLSLTLDIPPVYRIDISSSGKNNTLALTKGKFYPITIEIHSIGGNFDKKLQTTVLKVSDDRFIMPQEKYYVNTSDTLAIRTFIGVGCDSTFSETEIKEGVQIYMATENESFQPQNVSVTVIEEQIELNLNISDNTIGLNTYGVVHPSEAVLNTNPITIQFDVDATHNESLLFEHNELVINSSLDYIHFYSQKVKFYVNNSKVDSDVNDINIKASIKDNKCYVLNANAASFNVSIKADTKETDVTQSEIAFEGVLGDDDILYFTLSETLSKNVVYGSMSCALVANDLQMVSDENIQQQEYPNDVSYKHRLVYFAVQISESNNKIKIPLTTIDKYKKYNYRCLYANNAYRNEHIKSIVVENKKGEFIDATQALLFGYPSCWEAHISNLTQPIIYDENLGRYASLNIYEGGRDNYDENGCLKFEYRNVDEFYANEHKKGWTVKSFCVYSEPTCNITKFNWNTMASTVETKLTKVMTDKYKVEEAAGVSWINIEAMRQIYFVNLNADYLKLSRYVKHDKAHIQLTLNNIHNEPVECLYDFSKHDQTVSVNSTVFAKENKVRLTSGRNDDVVLTLPFAKEEYDDEVYSLKLLCNSIPGWEVTETVDNAFTAFYFVHDEKIEIDCESNKQQLVCLNGKIERQEFNDLETNVEGIDVVIEEVEAFKKKMYNEKKDALDNAVNSVEKEESDVKTFPLGIQIDEYMAVLDCYESKAYEECVSMKKEYESKVITKLINTIYKSEASVSNYVNSFANENLMKDILSQLLIKCLSLGNVADTLTQDTSKQALNLTYSLLNEVSEIVNIVQTLYKDDANYNNIIKDVVTLYFKAVSSMQNVIKYMDVQKFISVPGDASHEYFIQDDLLTKYVNTLSPALSNLLIKTESTSFENSNFKYTYLPLNVTNLLAEQILNEVSVSYNEAELVKAGVTGIPILTHKAYPLLSEFKDDQTYAQYIFGLNVVNANGMNTQANLQLATPLEFNYDRTLLDMNLTYCYRVVDGKLSTEGITAKVDSELNVLTCSVSATGDVIATTKEVDMKVSKGFPMWILILVIVAVLLIVVGIIMWFKCCKTSSPIIPSTDDPLIPEQ